jgi:L-arabinose isomerase
MTFTEHRYRREELSEAFGIVVGEDVAGDAVEVSVLEAEAAIVLIVSEDRNYATAELDLANARALYSTLGRAIALAETLEG